ELQAKNDAANAKLRQMVKDQQEAEKKKVQSQEIQQQLATQTVAINEKRDDVMADLAQVEPAVIDAQNDYQKNIPEIFNIAPDVVMSNEIFLADIAKTERDFANDLQSQKAVIKVEKLRQMLHDLTMSTDSDSARSSESEVDMYSEENCEYDIISANQSVRTILKVSKNSASLAKIGDNPPERVCVRVFLECSENMSRCVLERRAGLELLAKKGSSHKLAKI
ncbi:hypothetical protein TSAR_006521, partial [Trichomalopsis sarcophagae]